MRPWRPSLYANDASECYGNIHSEISTKQQLIQGLLEF